MQSKIVIGIVLAAGIAAFASGCGGKITSYSAQQVRKDAAGRTLQSSKLFVTPNKIRIEPSGADGKELMIMIVRRDLKVLRILIPRQKTYIENPLNEAEVERALQQITVDANAKEEILGRETVNGFTCQKKRVETATRFLGREIKSSTTVWVSARLDFPLRTEHKDGSVTELENIRSGGQSKDLFEAPPDYKKVSNPFEAVSAGLRDGKSSDKPRRNPFRFRPKSGAE